MFTCTYVYMGAWMQVPKENRDSQSHGAGGTGGYEPPDVDTWNPTQRFWNNSMYS